ncbi:MFS transporter [Methylobacterium nodulans]|uniref:Major facilitator superfamily MFS_1 n=1 Tax=Methylobacterium nodulans (strain LMG 21967 / CNCM I-2342 / ORS 2060) TaxID=460265 RepID=B8IJ48_METNO|nr:MFS transporter [Methylobacterium nodulans]ACL61843.1 major facilitator superfamily MFS_1 [Methylobacterium nodulans ORS 2060]
MPDTSPDADPRAAIREGDMTAFQVVVVAICILICALDGFDVLVVAFTAAAIARDFALSPTDLGLLFSAGLAGMGLGALLIGPLGDRLGRRTTLLLCLGILCTGMLAAAFSRSLGELALVRLFTGLGIGGGLANVNIVVAEYASDRWRNLAISLMSLGYPIGATLGGAFSVVLIEAYGWRSVYVFGGLVALVLVPAVLAFMPESIDYLMARRPAGALAKINRVLTRMGRPTLAALPAVSRTEILAGVGPLVLLRPPYAARTAATCLAYFCVMMTSYFFLSWTPKVLTEHGLSISGGISGAMLMNAGGVVGCLLFGFGARGIGTRRLAAAMMVGLCLAGAILGLVPPTPAFLLAATLAIGFFLYASINAMYAVVPAVFPASVRTTGTGLAMSVGRLGAVAGPSLAGLLMAAGWDRSGYCAALAAPMLVAALSLAWVRAAGREDRTEVGLPSPANSLATSR